MSDELVAQAETEGIPGAEGFRVSRTNVGGNYNTKVRTTLAGRSMVPDIIGINSVIPLIGVFLIGSRHFIANLAAGSMRF
ncbi:hypothetical protein [Streptomyces sp. MAR4 CNX-425]|uniref:hypothetical protein n=1 Tax=Streptomyces sp. MAR4 CNX-425 TaxID=3406343 RepID=UPI003B508F8F